MVPTARAALAKAGSAPVARAAAASAALVPTAQAALGVAALAAIAQETKAADRSRRLRLAEGILYAEREKKHLFLQPSIPDWLVVNRNAAILLSRCDGSKTEAEIAADEIAAAGVQGIQAQTAALFAEAVRRGILVEDAASSGAALKGDAGAEEGATRRAAADSQWPVLGSVHLQLTNQCNLHCSYCYAQSGRPSEVLSAQELESIARQVQAIAPRVEYVLSGGEPLLHPQALEFAERVKAAGNVVHLLTNATLIGEENVERIARAADLVKISLDGSSEEVHGLTRGRNNFDRVVRAIDLLLRRNANVAVAMTVTRSNQGDIAAMVERFGSRLALQPLFKAGRGKQEDQLVLTGLEYYRALAAVEGVAPMGGVSQKLMALRGRGVRRCAFAQREISISETGEVYPCQMLHAEEFRAGSIRQQPLAEIYYQSPVFQRLRRIDVDSIGRCSVCAFRYLCGGACRARDFYEVGSVEEVGEFCAYEREALLTGLFDSVDL